MDRIALHALALCERGVLDGRQRRVCLVPDAPQPVVGARTAQQEGVRLAYVPPSPLCFVCAESIITDNGMRIVRNFVDSLPRA